AEALAAIRGAGYEAAPRLRFVARLSNYEDEIPVIADAVDPEADARVFAVARSVSEGSWLAAATDANEAVLGSGLAKELALGLGDEILVSAQTVNDATNADAFVVVGLVSCPSPELNRSGFFVSLHAARRLLDTDDELVNEIDVFLPKAPGGLEASIARADEAAAKLSPLLPGQRLDSLGELAKDYLAMRNMKAKFSYVMIFVVLIIAAVGIVNTILMSVYARIREIGVLRAYGMTAKDIGRLFTLEGMAIGAVGSALGVGFGALLDFFMIRFGFNLDAMMGDIASASVPISGMLYGVWNPKTMVVGFVFGLVVSLVAARIPARMAARMEPTDALRFS
ncbi:MAG: FtsX-like permease family protein, partial [Spirochaetaceae bacterium]|nr:FtsX-like permease family protein [Spirochaetaceae bacterium]